MTLYPSRCGHRAGTLLELLVVLSFIGILLGLLLSAVQKVRAMADRMRCGNHLRQIALAAHGYHDAQGHLPPAFRQKDTYAFVNWQVRLLPYLEQTPAWQQVTDDYAREPNPFKRPARHQLFDRPLPIFECPSDWRAGTAWTVETVGGPRRVAVASYLGSSGAATGDRAGVIYRGSRVGLTHIPDGTANTLMAGERPPSFNLVYGWWYAGKGQDGAGSLDSVLAAREKNRSIYPTYRACGAGPFPLAATRPEDPCGAFHYWSLHAGGTHFAFCDGSVRFLGYGADSVLPALTTRGGGEMATVPD